MKAEKRTDWEKYLMEDGGEGRRRGGRGKGKKRYWKRRCRRKR